jgi:hypothetical protein
MRTESEVFIFYYVDSCLRRNDMSGKIPARSTSSGSLVQSNDLRRNDRTIPMPLQPTSYPLQPNTHSWPHGR